MKTLIKSLFDRKWIAATLLAIFAIAVMVRLGIWQLDRLEQRRAFNQHYLEQISSAPLELGAGSIELDLENMEYRQVLVSGEYDFVHEVAIRNQVWDGQNGVHLLTPLRITGTGITVLVDRGWIPMAEYQTGNWDGFGEPGIIQVAGIIRLSQQPTFGGRSDPTPQLGESLRAWNFVNIPEISKQIPYPILPVYVQRNSESPSKAGPLPVQPEIEISEGPHLGYAVQWFIFATILAVGYPIFIHQEVSKQSK